MNDRDSFYYREQGSNCPLSSHEFAENLAADICSETGACLGGSLEIEIYTPPYEISLSNERAVSGGTLVLRITSADKKKVFLLGIEFGRFSKKKKPIRSGFDVQVWKNNPDDPFSTDIYYANFDETFRVICLLGLMLQLESVRISYGAYS